MRVLVVEDDDGVRELLRHALRAEGHEVLTAASMSEAVRRLGDRPEMILLDLGLPDGDGIDVLARLRSESSVPVLIVTAAGAELDRVLGLKGGADDYVVKPFSMAELLARVDAVARRAGPSPRAPVLSFGRLELDLDRRRVVVQGREVELKPKEFDLLAFLAGSPRRVFTKAELLSEVWASSSAWQGEATVTEHVHRLRRAIEDDPRTPRWLTTVWRVGYRFDP